MADKKKGAKTEAKRTILLGRPGNNVRMGIVGMPNVGKSSLFNILSKLNVPAENYPFCTIEPTDARVEVPDARFEFLATAFQPKAKLPAVLTITDIAGLVKGASEGKGLGNAFLSNIQAVDGIYHVCRAFADKEIEHVEGTVDPIRDLAIISEELILKDLAQATAKVAALTKMVSRGIDKTKAFDLATMQKVVAQLEAKKDVREYDWDGKEIEILNEQQFLTAKPVVYLVNISEKNFETQKNKWMADINKWVKARSSSSPVIPFSVRFEATLMEMKDDAARAEFLKEKKLISMVPRIITTGYHALNLIHYFTCGPIEVRAWTIKAGTLAPQAAGVIHSDFEKGFIASETMAYDDFKEHGSEQGCKKAGKYKTQGKLYVVQDGDICFFKHGEISKGKK